MQFAKNVFPRSAQVDQQGNVKIEDIAVSDIVSRFSTPVVIYSKKDIIDVTDEFIEVFDQVFFASKAAPIIDIEREIFARGAGCDVASAGELEVALRAGCDPKKIVVHGNNKSDEDITKALEISVARIVVEDEHECDRIEKIARKLEINTVDVQIRLTPGIEAHTHEYLMTGAIDSKFGSVIEHGVANRICNRIIESDILQLRGLHCHIGTQIFDTEPLAQAAKVAIEFYVSLMDKYKELGITSAVSEINVGGGFGIHYSPEDDPPLPIEMAKAVRASAHETCQQYAIQDLEIWVEPGRALVGQAGMTAYKVGSVKEIPNVRNYVAVDGGMSDNIRPAMYGAKHLCWVNGRNSNAGTQVVTVAGKHCEEGDLLAKDVELPIDVQVDDILLMASTGAYSFAMASNYNMLTRPSVVLVDSGEVKEIVRRESIDDILSRMV